MAITAALPFTVIMLLMCVSLYRGLRYEFTVEGGPEGEKAKEYIEEEIRDPDS